jgi:hypothetical protein
VFCGDGTCAADEAPETCPADCGLPAFCTDGVCDFPDENCQGCPQDCQSGATCDDGQCGNGVCDGTECQDPCATDGCLACAADCGVCEECGDGQCLGSETHRTCSQDCGCTFECGDGDCCSGESCAVDCAELCNDGVDNDQDNKVDEGCSGGGYY